MKTKQMLFTVIGLVMSVVGLGNAQAVLHDRGSIPFLNNGLVYDDVLDITWQKNANLAATEPFGVSFPAYTNGRMDWDTANLWIDAMNEANYLGYDNWRLPGFTGIARCSNWNCTDSELGYMFYINMGATADNSILDGSNTDNLALFDNLQTFRSSAYWLGEENIYRADSAWSFYTRFGFQNNYFYKYNAFHPWAVRSGDVAFIPISGAVWLFGTGLLGLMVFYQRCNIKLLVKSTYI